jgi:hypothetical protein
VARGLPDRWLTLSNTTSNPASDQATARYQTGRCYNYRFKPRDTSDGSKGASIEARWHAPTPTPSDDENDKVAHIGQQRHKVYRHASD